MDTKLLNLWIFNIILLVFVPKVLGDYSVLQYCQLVKSGTKLPSSDSCQKFYSCQSADKIIEDKCASTEVFDKDTQSCIVKKLKDCKLDYDKNGDIKNICDIMENDIFFGDFKDCQKWHKCKQDKPMSTGKCPEDYVFDVNLRACIPSNKNSCQRVITCWDGERKPDMDNCAQYQECKAGKWLNKKCDNQKYFDTLDEICKERQLAKPIKTCDRCLYSNQRWVNAVDEKCTNYLFCKQGKKEDKIGSCGANSYFHEERQVCLVGAYSLEEYVPKNGACLCDWLCELEECLTYACKEQKCQKQKSKTHQAKCKIAICESENCKMQACNLYEKNSEKSLCKEKLCHENNIDLKEKIHCKINHLCETNNRDCKIKFCNEFEDNTKEKVQCILQACSNDQQCKEKACEEYPLPEDVSKCKLEICEETFKEESKKEELLECKINICKDISCKHKICETLEDQKKKNDKKKKKDNEGEENEENEIYNAIVQCKVNSCGKDRDCKIKVCEDHPKAEICKK